MLILAYSDVRLRGASNEGTLRAFRNADRFLTLEIFRRALFDDVSLQVNRGDLIGFQS